MTGYSDPWLGIEEKDMHAGRCGCEDCVCGDVDAIIDERAKQDNQTAEYDLRWDVQ